MVKYCIVMKSFSAQGPRRTLLVIDMQNDFIFGSLPVPGAQDIINKVEDLTKLDIWHQVRPNTLCPFHIIIILIRSNASPR